MSNAPLHVDLFSLAEDSEDELFADIESLPESPSQPHPSPSPSLRPALKSSGKIQISEPSALSLDDAETSDISGVDSCLLLSDLSPPEAREEKEEAGRSWIPGNQEEEFSVELDSSPDPQMIESNLRTLPGDGDRNGIDSETLRAAGPEQEDHAAVCRPPDSLPQLEYPLPSQVMRRLPNPPRADPERLHESIPTSRDHNTSSWSGRNSSPELPSLGLSCLEFSPADPPKHSPNTDEAREAGVHASAEQKNPENPEHHTSLPAKRLYDVPLPSLSMSSDDSPTNPKSAETEGSAIAVVESQVFDGQSPFSGVLLCPCSSGP